MKLSKILSVFILILSFAVKAEKPNIIFIMSDDQGYGDASCYNPESKFQTPGIDRIAKEGIRFTDAHSASAVCTPTRYGLLTGRYPWRSKLQKGVMVTGQGNLLTKELTIAQFLKNKGYKTALIGKCHLGFNYEMPDGQEMSKTKTVFDWDTYNVNKAPIGSKVIDGPIKKGFDFYRGFHHAREMHSWIDQDEVVKHIELTEVLPELTRESVNYIKERADKKDGPFFLYVPLGSPHTPIAPSKNWLGKSGVNPYADFVMETDNSVVEILNALDQTGMAENTIIFFTTDNGCSPKANYKELLGKGHDPSYSLRGHKADAWDGGHRVPYVVRWPKKIKAGQVSDELICHNNLFATCAEILGEKIPEGAAPDSFSILPVLESKESNAPTHPVVIHHSYSGLFAIRQGNWKYLACQGSGGWSQGGDGKPSQLYDLSKDLKESNNLVDLNPEKAQQMLKLLEDSIAKGRTTPGPNLKNDAEVIIWKKAKSKKGNKKKK